MSLATQLRIYIQTSKFVGDVYYFTVADIFDWGTAICPPPPHNRAWAHKDGQELSASGEAEDNPEALQPDNDPAAAAIGQNQNGAPGAQSSGSSNEDQNPANLGAPNPNGELPNAPAQPDANSADANRGPNNGLQPQSGDGGFDSAPDINPAVQDPISDSANNPVLPQASDNGEVQPRLGETQVRPGAAPENRPVDPINGKNTGSKRPISTIASVSGTSAIYQENTSTTTQLRFNGIYNSSASQWNFNESDYDYDFIVADHSLTTISEFNVADHSLFSPSDFSVSNEILSSSTETHLIAMKAIFGTKQTTTAVRGSTTSATAKTPSTNVIRGSISGSHQQQPADTFVAGNVKQNKPQTNPKQIPNKLPANLNKDRISKYFTDPDVDEIMRENYAGSKARKAVVSKGSTTIRAEEDLINNVLANSESSDLSGLELDLDISSLSEKEIATIENLLRNAGINENTSEFSSLQKITSASERRMSEWLNAGEDGVLNLESLLNPREMFVLGCTFYDIPCDLETDFTATVQPGFGVCFTYTNADVATNISAEYANQKGLAMVLDVQIDEYPLTASSGGVKILVHETDRYPFLDSFGVVLPTAVNARVQIEMIETRRMSVAGNPCTEKPNDMLNLYNETCYSYEGCMRSMLQLRAINERGCYYPSIPSNGNSSGLELCEDKEMIFQMETNTTKPGENCFRECRSIYYKTGTSLASTENLQSSTFHSTYNGSAIKLHLFIKTHVTVVYTEDLAIKVNDLFSTLCQLMGLFVGCSAIEIAAWITGLTQALVTGFVGKYKFLKSRYRQRKSQRTSN